jgi:NCAIR mutase (PurE)-related protein
MLTRVDAEKADALGRAFPGLAYLPEARVMRIGGSSRTVRGTVAVVTAGSSDQPVAEEAVATLDFFNVSTTRAYDCGVAGLHRLFAQGDSILAADVIIAVAGMEGALASVVAGLFPRPVVAVPTSVGYGASFSGLAALLAMMNSCAPGVTVVNIDNGFGAAVAATAMLRVGER